MSDKCQSIYFESENRYLQLIRPGKYTKFNILDRKIRNSHKSMLYFMF